MSSFFTAPASQRKRKRQDAVPSSTSKRRNTSAAGSRPQDQRASTRRRQRSESISGSESDSDDGMPDAAISEEDGSDYENETAAEKRLRLAEQYLENISAEVDEVGFDAAEIDRDLIAERLKEDVAESKGKVYRHIADKLDFDSAVRTFFRADQTDITAVAACSPYLYTVAKDKSIVKWELPSQSPSIPSTDALQEDQSTNTSEQKNPKFTTPLRPKKVAFARGRPSKNNDYPSHTSSILCAAASTTGRFLVTGGLDRRIVVWDVSSPSSLSPIKVFSQHRDAVTGLAFRRGTNQLYSCSRDRTIKVWSLDELAYVETLFGHQDSVMDIAAAAKEVCVSVGARDKSARLWKVGEETQLVFRGGGVAAAKGKSKESSKGDGGLRVWQSVSPELLHAEGSIDRVAMIDDETFVTGSDNGALSLWSVHKKKPVQVIPLAHGLDPITKLEESYPEEDLDPEKKPPAPPMARWITALTSLPYSDVVLTGSWDGTVKAWKVRTDKKGLESLGVVSPILDSHESNGSMNGLTNGQSTGSQKRIEGVINDLIVVEKGERAKQGITVVAVTSREHRLGRWNVDRIRSTAIKFDISRRRFETAVNGINGHANARSDESDAD